MFEIKNVTDGKMFTVYGDLFKAKVYVPDNDLPGNIINFGYDAPYFIVFEEEPMSEDAAISYAKESGLATTAASHDASVVFVYPDCEGGWANADVELFKELVASSKIGQDYENGVLINRDRFGKAETTYKIRGAIFRTFLFGTGKSADFIAQNLCTRIDGQYLWGPGEITPTAVILKNLSVVPNISRRDIPVVSVGNSEEIELAVSDMTDYYYKTEKEDMGLVYSDFLKPYLRWCGTLVLEQDLNKLGVVKEYGTEIVKTTPDNLSMYAGSETHEVGYFAWYNKKLAKEDKVPTVVVFHGGGDSALHISKVSGWWEIAHKYNFLLIAVENHLNLTASETIELLDNLKEKYPIDDKRIYASGFSMGGCKTWDMLQEYPEYFAALAPMDATYEVGLNVYGKQAPRLNRKTGVPIFYAGGEITPLPELPFQAEKCYDRIKYVFEVDRIVTEYNVSFENRANWDNPIWGISGDRVEKIEDKSRNSILTINYFADVDGVERLALASISEQGHECRQHTCEHAWLFMSGFSKA